MSDALFEALGIDEKALIDPTEVAEIQRTLGLIRIEAAKIAKGYDTDDTMVMLKALHLVVKTFATEATPEMARKMVNARNAGETIPFGGDTSKLEQELAEAEAKARQLEDNLKKLQDAANGSGLKGLGAGSSTDSIMEEIKTQVSGDPDRAKGILDLFKQLSGLDPKEYKARAGIMGRIAFAQPDWNLVPDPGTGEMLPSILVAANQKKVAVETERDALKKELDPFNVDSVAHQLAMAEKDLDPATTGSVGNKAQWFDYHDNNVDGWKAKLTAAETALTVERDATVATSLAGKLAAANTELTKVKKERDDAVAVRTPMENAFNSADTLLNEALDQLGDDKFLAKKLIPGNVKTARDKVGKAMATLYTAQNPAKAKP